jgi:Condensin complex protein MksE
MPTHKKTQEVFEILSKGQFISSNSSDERIRKLFNAVEENYDELGSYFSEIGFTLERGDEYFYFSRSESRTDLERKIESAYKWIDILDFFKAYDNGFGPGYRFSPSDILVKMNVDAVLKSKLAGLKRYTREEKYAEGIQRLIDLLCREGFAELENEVTHSYKILSSFSYLETLIMSIHIPENIQHEIPE